MRRTLDLFALLFCVTALSGGITAVAWVERMDSIQAQAESELLAQISAQAELAYIAKCSQEQGQALAVWVSDTKVKCLARRGGGKQTYSMD